VKAALPSGYQCVASPQLIGMLLLVFVAPELAVGSVSTATVGTGLMGYGNKGAVGVRIVLGDTLRLTFIDCHLAAFANAVDRRNWDAAEVVRRMWFKPVEKDVVGLAETNNPATVAAAGEGLDKMDVVIWCGDLNYRIDLDNSDIRSLLQPYMPHDLPPTHDGVSSPVVSLSPSPKLPLTPTEAHPSVATTLQGTIKSLLKHDQLLKQKREGKAFAGYKEGKVTFLPTYKYDVGKVGSWDSSEKARAPGWCDRILWRLKAPTTGEKDSESGSYERRHSHSDAPDEILTPVVEDEILFEIADNSDSDEEDLVVSRAESPLPLVKLPVADRAASPVFDDPTSSFDTSFGEVWLKQMSYTSHQNITSSDHKPISATFQLAFPAVVPDLRAKIHGEVAREVDKLENDCRPVVTVIIDQPDGSPSDEDVINFGPVRFWESKCRNVTVANTGTSKAKIHFVGLPSASGSGSEAVCKPWILLEWLGTKAKQNAELEPGEVVNISITLLVSTVKQVLDLNNKREVLDDVLVLRVDGGRDVFIPISAKWLYSSYGTTLKELVKIPEDVGGFRGYREAEEKQKVKEGPLYSAPREIYRITQFLCDSLADVVSTLGPEEMIGEKRWFSQLGWPFLKETWTSIDDERRRMIEVGVYEAMDTDRDFEDPECVRVIMQDEEEEVSKEELVEAAASVFLCWLEGLSDGVVPAVLWDEVVKAGGDTKASEQVNMKPILSIHLPDQRYLGSRPPTRQGGTSPRECIYIPSRVCSGDTCDSGQEEGGR